MAKLRIMSSGENQVGKIVRSDMSVKAGDSCVEVATDPAIIEAVESFDATLGVVEQKLRDNLSYVQRRDALEGLDTGVIGQNTQPHSPSRLKTFSAGVLRIIK